MVWAAGLAWWRARDVVVRDAAGAAFLLALTLVPRTGRLGAAIGDLPPRPLDGWAVPLVGLYGGELRAGPAPDGTFRVYAALPRSGDA